MPDEDNGISFHPTGTPEFYQKGLLKHLAEKLKLLMYWSELNDVLEDLIRLGIAETGPEVLQQLKQNTRLKNIFEKLRKLAATIRDACEKALWHDYAFGPGHIYYRRNGVSFRKHHFT